MRDDENFLKELMAIGAVFEDMMETARVVTLLSGTKDDDTEFWAYIAVPQEKFEPYLKIRAQGNFDIADWGEILLHGSGTHPNVEEKQELFDRYGIDADALEQLENLQL